MTELELHDGEVIESTDVDALVEAYERVTTQLAALSATKKEIVAALEAMTEGRTKTEYVRGLTRRVKVVHADDVWDNSLLKEVWNSYPGLADSYLRIEKIAPQLREVKKLAKETGGVGFMAFRDMVLRANLGNAGRSAWVKVEE